MMRGSNHQPMLLSVLMPVFNESRTLRTIVGRVRDAPLPDGVTLELVCVDDGSADDSWRILTELAEEHSEVRIHRHPVNRGKGAAIRTAIDLAGGDLAIVQDSDLEYDPRDIQKVIGPIVDGRADAVYGSRFASSPERRVLLFWHSVGNRLLTAMSNMVNDLNLTDMETCYKAVRLDVLKRLRLTSERFGIEPEITTRLAQYGARIYEVPISYDGRTYAEGKNIGWRDGVEAVWLIFKFRFLDTKHVVDDELATRQSIGAAPRYRRWILDVVRPWLGESVLEVNAGPGHMTSQLLDRRRLVSADPEPSSVESIRRRFGHMENVRAVVSDFSDPADRLGGETYDTVLCLEGLQRHPDPKGYVEALASLVEPGGCLVLQVPADSSLYGAADAAMGHVRRFDRSDVAELIESADMDVEMVRRFNTLGYFGWIAHDRIRRTRISRTEAATFNAVVPLARIVDRLLPDRGLSFLAVGRRR